MSEHVDDFYEWQFGQFLELQPGWNGHDAPTPSEAAIQAAKTLLSRLGRDDPGCRVLLPSAQGGVELHMQFYDHKADVTFHNDGVIWVMLNPGETGGEPDSKSFLPGPEQLSSARWAVLDHLRLGKHYYEYKLKNRS